MNEKIKSLANIWANRRQVEDRLGVTYVFTEEALQVYTNKIVNECLEVIDTQVPGMPGVYAMEKIEKIFGVTE